MAGRQRADIVFCLDASASMEPAINGVRNHIFALVESLNGDCQYNWDVRFGFLAYSTPYDYGQGEKTVRRYDKYDGEEGMVFMTVKDVNEAVLAALYRMEADANGSLESRLFTTDIEEFRRGLSRVECVGDETPAVALDMAADFPFRDAASCHRVIVFLTDETMEDGSAYNVSMAKLNDLAMKIQGRRIALYMIAPQSDGYDMLSQIDRCEWTIVDGAAKGLSSIDFGKLMQNIGKSVSVSQSTQVGNNSPKPLFNEDSWHDDGNCVKTDIADDWCQK